MKARRWPLRRADGKRALLRLALSLLLALVVLRGLVPGVAPAGAAGSPAVGPPAERGAPLAADNTADGGSPAADDRPPGDGKPARPGTATAGGTPTRPLPESSEALASRSPWSRPESYPLALKPRADLYRPSAAWLGRLILPSVEDLTAPLAPAEDWVWIEIEQAPAERQALIGQRLRLRWADRPELRRLVQTVTTTIRLGEAARQAAAAANVVPTRLDGRRVGPLQSLAGARLRDDVTVALEAVSVAEAGAAASPTAETKAAATAEAKAAARTAATTTATTTATAAAPGVELRVASPPVQITGRWQGLVRVVGRGSGEDLWRVRHYNPSGGCAAIGDSKPKAPWRPARDRASAPRQSPPRQSPPRPSRPPASQPPASPPAPPAPCPLALLRACPARASRMRWWAGVRCCPAAPPT
ncbi:MAG: hypothetical protein ACK46L_16880, partial [Synechococcaceae cyanobacterium]